MTPVESDAGGSGRDGMTRRRLANRAPPLWEEIRLWTLNGSAFPGTHLQSSITAISCLTWWKSLAILQCSL
ncbi:hypothetical protein EYF80_030699 [Liparis tanakae]|uniref:Uncharacterized protein n=1 Tax=Liparis tanakae TaxID=230148 RepID=A0A4Z2H146_9TELE|nr:hypothetical protein EYF80_030699 [Liparis tanakae]